ncbi:MAG: hypothetical protein Q9195_009196 [Heterodermia aff. obscurata]
MARRSHGKSRKTLPPEHREAIRGNATVTVWDGDLTKRQLGLDNDKISQMKRSVNIYIHAACSISLRRSLPQIATSIVEPSLELAEIALSSKRLERFLYVSTAYANSHLHHLHQGIETWVSERIYSLRNSGGDSTDLELDDLRNCGTTPEYTSHNFPFPYAYAKHLTERLLVKSFQQKDREGSLLILRPSIIGPALREPFPNYEIRGSAPATNVLAAFIGAPSRQLKFSSRFRDPMTESTLDEVPVDIVVNRILMHLYRQSEGCVHAVAGASGRHQFKTVWDKAMSERRLLWHPRAVWLDVDWHSRLLHGVAQAFVIMGTSYMFEDDKVHPVWNKMVDDEKAVFPLFARKSEELDLVVRRDNIRQRLGQWLARNGMPLILLELLISSASSSKGHRSKYYLQGSKALQLESLWSGFVYASFLCLLGWMFETLRPISS